MLRCRNIFVSARCTPNEIVNLLLTLARRLQGTGGYSFLLNAPQVYTLVALSDSVLFTMKADETPKDGDYEQEYTERHDPDCLSAALCGTFSMLLSVCC